MTPSTSASTRSMRRSVVRSMLLSNGSTSGMRKTRNVISRTLICPLAPSRSRSEVAPRREQIMRSGRARANAHGRVTSLKPALELFPDSALHARKLRGIGLPPLVELCGNGDGRGRIGGLRELAPESGEDASRIEAPFDDKAVRRKAEVERALGHPLEIRHVNAAQRG